MSLFRDFRDGAQILLELTGMIGGGLSIIGSSCILYVIWRDRKNKWPEARFRYIAMLSVADLFPSFMCLVWNLIVPSNVPYMWLNIGNKSTCDLGGYFAQLSVIGAFYSTALSQYYYCKVVKGMTESQYAATRSEILWHVLAWVYPFTTASIALWQDLYSFSSLGCFMVPHPFGCHADPDLPCERGHRAYLYVFLFMGVPVLQFNNMIAFHMYKIHDAVKKTVERSMQWANNATTAASNELNAGLVARKREAATQAFLYIGAYVATRSPGFVVFGVDYFGWNMPFIIVYLHLLFFPLQGFFNVFIFLRPRINTLRGMQAYQDMSYPRAFYLALFDYEKTVERGRNSTRRGGENKNNSNNTQQTYNTTSTSLASGASSSWRVDRKIPSGSFQFSTLKDHVANDVVDQQALNDVYSDNFNVQTTSQSETHFEETEEDHGDEAAEENVVEAVSPAAQPLVEVSLENQTHEYVETTANVVEAESLPDDTKEERSTPLMDDVRVDESNGVEAERMSKTLAENVETSSGESFEQEHEG